MMDQQTSKNTPISYKPPKDRRAEFERMVSESGLSRNAFITEAVFGRSRHRPGELKFLARILAMCGKIAELLASVSCSSDEQVRLLLEQTRSELITIRTLLMQALGRRS